MIQVHLVEVPVQDPTHHHVCIVVSETEQDACDKAVHYLEAHGLEPLSPTRTLAMPAGENAERWGEVLDDSKFYAAMLAATPMPIVVYSCIETLPEALAS